MPWARAQPVTPDDHSELVPLLPIPNRTVKRLCADDSGRTSVKVGHRQAFIAQNPQLNAAGFVFGHANALAPRGRTGYAALARPAWGTGPLQPRLAQDMNTRKARGSRRGPLRPSLRASRAPAIAAACWSPAGDHTPRPRGSGGNAGRTGLSGMRTLKAPRICREASAPATSSGLLPLSGARSASDYGTACPLAARNALIRSTACRKVAGSPRSADASARDRPHAAVHRAATLHANASQNEQGVRIDRCASSSAAVTAARKAASTTALE